MTGAWESGRDKRAKNSYGAAQSDEEFMERFEQHKINTLQSQVNIKKVKELENEEEMFWDGASRYASIVIAIISITVALFAFYISYLSHQY